MMQKLEYLGRSRRTMPCTTRRVWAGVVLLLLSLTLPLAALADARGNGAQIPADVRPDSNTLSAAGPQIGSVTVVTPAPIEKYARYEIAFPLQTVATNPYFPYDTNTPPGVERGTGVTVNMLLLPPGASNWSAARVLPCFYYQPVEEMGSGANIALLPVGQPEWRARFTPELVGEWQYKIRATDATGTSESAVHRFTVVDSGRKGFVRVSDTDSRFFEFSDGTPFIAPLVSLEQGNPFESLAAIRASIRRLGEGAIRFVRWFPNGEGANYFVAPFGDTIRVNWAFGSSATTIDDVDSAAGKRFSFTPYYYSAQTIPAVPGARYRLSFRAKVTGQRVLRAELGNLGRIDIGSASSTYHEANGRGDTCTYKRDGWHDYVLEVTNTSATNLTAAIRGLYVSSDAASPYNTVQPGSIRIHSLQLQRDETGHGGWGPNLLTRSDPDTYNYVDQRSAACLDEIMRLSEEYGVYHKLPLFHKNDYVLNRFQPNGSVGSDTGVYNSNFYSTEGQAARWYENAYVRYFIARWSYSPALHSLELANENHLRPDSYDAGLDLAEYVHRTSPRHILMTNSFWGYFADSFFCDPGRGHLIDYADKHWYANTNSNNPEVISLTWQDSAAYVREAWVRFNEYRVGFNYNKPIVRGEGGVAQYNTEPQHPDIARDPTGTYYHKKLWAHVGSLGYLCDGEWYPRLFVMKIIGQFPSPEHNLEGMFAAYERFMQGEPLANGNYACIGTDLRGADQVLMANVGGNLRAWGVRDALAGRALLWIDNASHTWKSVVDGAQITPASGDLTVQGLPPGTYTVEWWDTTQGAVTRTDTREVGSNGRLGLRVDGLTTDVAVKIAPLLPTSKEYTLSLHKGWNLISSPLLPENANITDILAPVAGVYDSVYTYDASNGANPWRRYNPMAAPALQTLNAIDEKMGLWIHVEKDTTLPIEGAAPSAVSIPLYKGWNLVGYPSLTPRSVQDAFSSIAGAYDLVYTLDSTDPWQSYDAALAAATGAAATADAATSGAVAANSALNGLAQMEPGKGYWVRVKQDCVWTVAP